MVRVIFVKSNLIIIADFKGPHLIHPSETYQNMATDMCRLLCMSVIDLFHNNFPLADSSPNSLNEMISYKNQLLVV